MDPARQIADAVLYEGYILWPYRRSALKNQRRFTFGGVYPEAHHRARGGVDDPCTMETQCLLAGSADARVDVGVRFLHVVQRQVARRLGQELVPVDELTVGADRHLTWEEAAERETSASGLRLAALAEASHVVSFAIPATEQREVLVSPGGEEVGALLRSCEALAGTLTVGAEPAGDGLFRLTVTIANRTPWDGSHRERTLRRTFCSTHTVLEANGAEFVSLMDPPERHREAAQACRNAGTWPVLLGAAGERTRMLSSPIILYDHPQVAPESPGDLFDGGEIDQMLILNLLTLTEDEQAEMRATDPRAREILDRCAGLTQEQLMRLHGAIREFRPAMHP